MTQLASATEPMIYATEPTQRMEPGNTADPAAVAEFACRRQEYRTDDAVQLAR